MTRALTALRTACATGRDCQTVTVRRGHLRWLPRAYMELTREPPAEPAPEPAPELATVEARPVVASLETWMDSSPLQGMRRTGPVSLAVDGTPWVIASVGGELVAIRSREPCAEINGGLAHYLVSWLGAVPASAAETDLATLREWIGDAQPDLPDSSISLGWIDNRPVNRRLVNHALSLAPKSGPVRAWWAEARDPLVIAGDGWRVAVMPLVSGDGPRRAPRLRLTQEKPRPAGGEE